MRDVIDHLPPARVSWPRGLDVRRGAVSFGRGDLADLVGDGRVSVELDLETREVQVLGLVGCPNGAGEVTWRRHDDTHPQPSGEQLGRGELGELAETSGVDHEGTDEVAVVRAQVAGVSDDRLSEGGESRREDRGVVDEPPEARGD